MAMIVEELVLQVDARDLERFLRGRCSVWTSFLSRQPASVRKEVWVPRIARHVVMMVWWESRELWKSITDEQVAAVDRQMGEWFRQPVVREHAVVR
jgi:uncharacterized protein (TIGR03792 family)